MPLTWSHTPFGLEARDAREAAHSNEVTKRLSSIKYNCRLRNNHLNIKRYISYEARLISSREKKGERNI